MHFSIADYDTADTKFFDWDFGDNFLKRTSNSTLLHIYDTTGKFQPVVYIRTNENCRDTVNVIGGLTINGPTANFSAAASGCSNSPVMFTNNSTAFGSSLRQWLWSYGDGTTSTNNTPLNYSYSFPGIYTPNLMITDANGCTDTISDAINISSVTNS